MFPGGCALDCPTPARPPAFPQQQWTTGTWICPTRTRTCARRSAPTRPAAAPWTATSTRSSRTRSTTPARRRAWYLSLSPTLSLLSVPPSSLSRRRGAAWRAGTGDPHGGGSRRPRRVPTMWIHTAADPGRPCLLPAPTTWIHTATTRIHGETAPTCGNGADPARMTSPAADPARWRPRRWIQRGAVAPVLGCEWARQWAREWARRWVPVFFFCFF